MQSQGFSLLYPPPAPSPAALELLPGLHSAGHANLEAKMMCQHGTKNVIFISRELLAPGRAPVAAQFQQTVSVALWARDQAHS